MAVGAALHLPHRLGDLGEAAGQSCLSEPELAAVGVEGEAAAEGQVVVAPNAMPSPLAQKPESSIESRTVIV